MSRLGKLMRASTIQAMMKKMMSILLLMLILTLTILLTILNKQGILTFCDEFVPGDPPEYFFDKNPENFPAILELHRFVSSPNILLTRLG